MSVVRLLSPINLGLHFFLLFYPLFRALFGYFIFCVRRPTCVVRFQTTNDEPSLTLSLSVHLHTHIASTSSLLYLFFSIAQGWCRGFAEVDEGDAESQRGSFGWGEWVWN